MVRTPSGMIGAALVLMEAVVAETAATFMRRIRVPTMDAFALLSLLTEVRAIAPFQIVRDFLVCEPRFLSHGHHSYSGVDFSSFPFAIFDFNS